MTSGARQQGSSRSTRLISLARRLALASGLLFLVVLAFQVNLTEALTAFTQVSLPWTLAGFGVLVIPYVLRAWRFQVLLSERLPLSDLFYVTLVHSFARDMLPLGLGEAFYPSFLKTQRGVPLVEAVGSLAVTHVLDLTTLGFLFIIALSRIAAKIPQLARVTSVIHLALLGTVLAGLVLWVLRRPVLGAWDRWTRQGESQLGVRWKPLVDVISRALAAVQAITSARVLAVAEVLTLLLWIVTLAGTGIVYGAMGFSLGVWELTVLVSMMYFFAVLPIHSVGGLGTLDSLWVILILAFGIPHSFALSYTVLRRVFSTVFSILLGFIGLFKLGLRPWSRRPPTNSIGGVL